MTLKRFTSTTQGLYFSILMLSIFVALPKLAFSQLTTKHYEIKIAGIKVGQLAVSHSKDASGNESYAIDSKVDVNFLVYKNQTSFVSQSKYTDGILTHAHVDMNSNKGDFHTTTTKIKTGYKCHGKHQDGTFEKTITQTIKTNMARLYFTEPKLETQVYAEFYGGFMKLKKIEGGVYQGTFEDKKDLFYYKNGNLVKTVKENGIKDLEFVYVSSATKSK
jgi:hypothetical protein